MVIIVIIVIFKSLETLSENNVKLDAFKGLEISKQLYYV